MTAIHANMFSPKWKKEAKQLDKAAKKFINYKRDLLKDQQIEEIESRRKDLRQTCKEGDHKKYLEASKQLQATCENALPRQKPQGWFEENLEVIFVAIVIALGLRAYVVQPFRIPTGSMQPTLNGIIATSVENADEFPGFAQRQLERVSHGRTYVNIVLDEDKRLRKNNPIEEKNVFHFFTRTYIHFEDGSKVTFPGPRVALLGRQAMGFSRICGYPTSDMTEAEQLQFNLDLQNTDVSKMSFETRKNGKTPITRPYLKAGTVIARGYIDSGDLILVDKMSYHFRRPSRGEVFVFDTRNIQKIQSEPNAGSHYIKRLAGVPGDKLQIRGTDLYIDDQKATEPGFIKVMSNKDGYQGYDPSGDLANLRTMTARKSPIPGMNEYIALGDNSRNSSDSRAWGKVKEFNVIGPASFSLWPFMSGHWGKIK